MNNKVLLTVVCTAIAGSFSDGFCTDRRDADFGDENVRPNAGKSNLSDRARPDEGGQLDPETRQKINALHDVFMGPYKIQPQPVESAVEASAVAKTTTPVTTAATKKHKKKKKGHDTIDRAAAP